MRGRATWAAGSGGGATGEMATAFCGVSRGGTPGARGARGPDSGETRGTEVVLAGDAARGRPGGQRRRTGTARRQGAGRREESGAKW